MGYLKIWSPDTGVKTEWLTLSPSWTGKEGDVTKFQRTTQLGPSSLTTLSLKMATTLIRTSPFKTVWTWHNSSLNTNQDLFKDYNAKQTFAFSYQFSGQCLFNTGNNWA